LCGEHMVSYIIVFLCWQSIVKPWVQIFFFLVVFFRNTRKNSFNHCAPPLCISFVLVFIYFLLVTIVVSFSFASLSGIFSFLPHLPLFCFVVQVCGVRVVHNFSF
jgi:hypothetical protein